MSKKLKGIDLHLWSLTLVDRLLLRVSREDHARILASLEEWRLMVREYGKGTKELEARGAPEERPWRDDLRPGQRIVFYESLLLKVVAPGSQEEGSLLPNLFEEKGRSRLEIQSSKLVGWMDKEGLDRFIEAWRPYDHYGRGLPLAPMGSLPFKDGLWHCHDWLGLD